MLPCSILFQDLNGANYIVVLHVLVCSYSCLHGHVLIDTMFKTAKNCYKNLRPHDVAIGVIPREVAQVHCEFQRVRITGVPLARCQTSKNAT